MSDLQNPTATIRANQVFASIVFPMADLRPLFRPETEILLQPFRKRTSEAYVRRFGSGRYRQAQKQGQSIKLPGESVSVSLDFLPVLKADDSWFVSARRFLYVPDQPISPRLFADGFISARLEIPIIPPKAALLGSTKDLIKKLLDTTVELRSSRPGRRSPARQHVHLASVGSHFRDSFLAATTPEPLRRQAREDPAYPAAVAAKEALLSLEPFVLVIMPPGSSPATNVELHFDVVKTDTASFRTMTISPHSGDNVAVVRQARRSFTRLYSEGCAILKLVERYEAETASSQIKPKAIKRLEALSDRLCDASSALKTVDGQSVPLLGDVGPTLAAAADKLGQWLDETSPDAGRTQRRFAKELVRTAPTGAKVEVKLGDIFSNIQNSTIVNKSIVKDAFNVVKTQNEDAAAALVKVAELVAKSGNKEAGELLDQFNEELTKPQPRKSLLKRSWDALVDVLPTVTAIAGAVGAIAKLFV